MAKNQHISPQQFTQLIARSGIYPETIKARIRTQLTWGQLIRGKFSSTLEVVDSDVNSALRARNAGTGDAVGYIYTLYPVMVVIAQGSDANTQENKRREAETLRTRFTSCKEGLAFSHALRGVVVRDPITRTSSDLAPQLRTLLESMELGHLTTPEATPQGLQMFALCDKKETKTDTPLKHEVREELFNKRFDSESKKYLDEIRKQAMIQYQ
jgi:peptidyl-prolyl cis-trans isomerase SurA